MKLQFSVEYYTQWGERPVGVSLTLVDMRGRSTTHVYMLDTHDGHQGKEKSSLLKSRFRLFIINMVYMTVNGCCVRNGTWCHAISRPIRPKALYSLIPGRTCLFPPIFIHRLLRAVSIPDRLMRKVYLISTVR